MRRSTFHILNGGVFLGLSFVTARVFGPIGWMALTPVAAVAGYYAGKICDQKGWVR